MTYAFGGMSVSLGTPQDDEHAGRSGELARDLTDLLVALGTAAQEHETGVVFLPQQRYLRAMAELGDREVSSGEVATTLGMRSSAQAGQVREALIKKGLIYSPRLGHAAFTVPQFAGYMKRHFELEHHAPRRGSR